jgi:hypothetical protein
LERVAGKFIMEVLFLLEMTSPVPLHRFRLVIIGSTDLQKKARKRKYMQS